MNLLKVLLAGAAVGVIVTAFRDYENETWLLPERPFGGFGADEDDELGLEVEPEPVLGYDGMDQETLIDWLASAELDRDALLRVRDYEVQGGNREPVLSAIDDLL